MRCAARFMPARCVLLYTPARHYSAKRCLVQFSLLYGVQLHQVQYHCGTQTICKGSFVLRLGFGGTLGQNEEILLCQHDGKPIQMLHRCIIL